jgi:eukaryotic-like serine/threonine-protein kinase
VSNAAGRIIGRYALHGEIAAGGMATVHFGRLLGPVGFSRTVAIKRLHAQFAKNPEFVSMFLDEARLAARIRHPNVVATLDVVATEGELFLVMDYVQGESLSRLLRAIRQRGERIPPRIVATIMSGVLHGLHSAHDARSERGEPLDIVHRDVSPQNVLVGTDGVARVLDFGVAKATGRIQTTREGHLKGKIAYMAPEQFGGTVTRQTDVYAAAIVTWEALTSQRLIAGEDEVATLAKALQAKFSPPSEIVKGLPKSFDDVVMRGLAVDVEERFQTAREMAIALESCVGVAAPSEVGGWVEAHASEILTQRAIKISEIEQSSSSISTRDLENMVSQLNRGGGASTPRAPAPSNPGGRPIPADEGVIANPPSQPSSISVTNSGAQLPFRKPGSSKKLLLAGLAVVALAAVAFAALRPGASQSPAAAADAPASADPAPSATAAATANASAASSGSPAPSADGLASGSQAAPTSEPTERDEPAKPRPARPASRPGAAPVAARPSAAPKARPAKGSCDPPYTLDSGGRKKYKMECL